MTLEEFLQNYGGNACVSIEGYCEEACYDYYKEMDESLYNVLNEYKMTCIANAPWWNEAKGKEVMNWNIIGDGEYKVELYIRLKEN